MDNNTFKRLEYIEEQLSDYIVKRLLEPEYTGFCALCNEIKTTMKMREQNTQYINKDSNYIECCKDCFKKQLYNSGYEKLEFSISYKIVCDRTRCNDEMTDYFLESSLFDSEYECINNIKKNKVIKRNKI